MDVFANVTFPPYSNGTSYSISAILQSTAETFFGLCAIVSNGILLILAYKNPSLRKDAKRLQITLAVADLILGVGTIMLTVDGWRIQFWNTWYTAYYCIFIGLIKLFGSAFSLTIIFAMTMERLFAVVYPMKYRSANKRRIAYSLIFFSFAICITFANFGFYGVDNDHKPKDCLGGTVRIPALKPMLSYFNCAVGSAVVLLYAILLVSLKIQRKKNAIILNSSAQNEEFKQEMEVTKFVLVIVFGCIVFYVIPNITLNILTAAKSTFNANALTSLLSLCNSWINFVLYMWKDKAMRKAFIKFSKGIQTTDVEQINLGTS